MKLFKNLGKIKKSLTMVGNKEPLNFFSILLLISLDIFVVINIFWGLNTQSSQVTSPTERVPYECSGIISSTNTENREKIISYIKEWSEHGVNNIAMSYFTGKKVMEECKNLYSVVLALNSDELVKKNLNFIKSWTENISTINSNIRNIEEEYDTSLLEKIAGQDESNSLTVSSVSTAKGQIERYKERISFYEKHVKKSQDEILSSTSVKSIFEAIQKNKGIIKEKLKEYRFWYPLQIYFSKLIFVIPIFLIFFFLYKRSSKKEASIFSLVYAHLLVISVIPIIFGIFEMIFKILPERFFNDFIRLLELLNIGVFINYFLILLGILVIMFVIYIVQKKLFNKQKVRMKRISKSKCPYCSFKVSRKDLYCYHCGEAQKIKCVNCLNLTHKEGVNCTVCGVKDFDNKNTD